MSSTTTYTISNEANMMFNKRINLLKLLKMYDDNKIFDVEVVELSSSGGDIEEMVKDMTKDVEPGYYKLSYIIYNCNSVEHLFLFVDKVLNIN
jgi:hypothetical protein